jgi:hypothetical protein
MSARKKVAVYVADKHHRGMASANRNLDPGEQEGWCVGA